MKERKNVADNMANLRQKAEMLLNNQSPQPLSEVETDLLALIHELEVYQIELEMQNDELMLAKELAENSTLKYSELYDFAPAGYFTLSAEGEIMEVNLGGAGILGRERSLLAGSRFAFFVSDDTRACFSLFLDKVFKSKTIQTCEVTLSENGRLPLYALLSAIVSDKQDQCLVSAVDITQQKLTVKKLKENELFLNEIQMIARLGTFSIDFVQGKWEGSESLDIIFGIEPGYDRSFEGWVSILHPAWRQLMRDYFYQEVLAESRKFDKEYQIIRQNDKSEHWVHGVGRLVCNELNQPVRLIGTISEITERKLAEEALKESESKYRELIENSPDAICIYVDGKIALVNNQCLHLLAAKSPGELIGQPVINFIHPDFQELAKVRMSDITENGKVVPLVEEKFIRLDGSVVDVEVKAMPILFEGRHTVQLVARDISERKLAEKAVMESQDRLSRTQGLAHLGSWELDIESGNLIWSDEVYRIFGLLPQEFAATHAAFMESVHPEDREALSKAYFDSVEKNQPGYELEHRIIQKRTGEIRFVYEKCEHFRDASGRIARSVGMVLDITGRKLAEDIIRKSEEKFRALFEANTDGITIFLLNPSGPPSNIIDMNENAARMVGFTKAEMLLMTPDALELDLTPEKIGKRMHDVQSRGFSDFETRIRHKEGHAINVEIKVLAINYYNQLALMNIVRDITERKNIELRLQEYATELSKQIAEKDKFFSIIAHDLRSPFNSMLGFIQLLEEELPGFSMEEIQDFVKNISKSANKLFLLLENLLEWSLIQRGLSNFNPVKLLLKDEINASIELVRDAAEKKLIIKLDFSQDLKLTADARMFESLIRNLVFNAIKFTPRGGHIGIKAHPEPDDSIVLSVGDTGIGMDKDMIGKLFHLDENTYRKGTEGESSTGLGLIICKDFIEKHGGEIWVESEVGVGTTFFFRMPGRR